MKETGVGTGIINGRVFAEKGKQEIADGAVRMMLPALVYAAEKDQTDTPSKDLAWAVMRWLWPAGAFMTEQGKEETSGEDSRTYAMILEKQENDENAVDKNGKLKSMTKEELIQELIKARITEALHSHGILPGTIASIRRIHTTEYKAEGNPEWWSRLPC